uniref:RING-type domain-containing protein n=1 Tax=Chrysotila carterae TaxID=13221 RepID=A0A7S4C2E8_CHRCT
MAAQREPHQIMEAVPHGRLRSRTKHAEHIEEEVVLSDALGDGILGLRLSDKPLPQAVGGKRSAVIVHSTFACSAAEGAGLQPGDVILAVNGTPVHSQYDALKLFRKHPLPVKVQVRHPLPSCNVQTPKNRSAAARPVEIYKQLAFNIYKLFDTFDIGLSFAAQSAGELICGDAVVHTVVAGSHAAAAGVQALDLILAVNAVKVQSTQHALILLKQAAWPIRISVGRMVYVARAATVIQRSWRRMKGVLRVVCPRPLTNETEHIEFDTSIGIAAVVLHVKGDFWHGRIEPGQAILFVNGAACHNHTHANELMRAAPGEVVLLCKEATYVDLGSLRSLSRGKHCNGHAVEASLECAVCLQAKGSPVPWIAGCGHHFCAECTVHCRNLSDACPLCRSTAVRLSATGALLRAKRRVDEE